MSFFKYYNERQDADGEKLWWPGGPDGFPFRGGQPPQTTKDEFEKLKLTGKARCRLFYLDTEADLKDYITIRDKCANGLYVPIDRDRVWDEDRKNYRIFLEWLELGYDNQPITEGSRDAVRNYIQQPQGETLPYSRLAGVKSNQDGANAAW
jgi:hypothetical protein